MGKSTQFNRDGDPDVKKVANAGPLGILPIMWIVVIAVMVIVAGLVWWLR